MATSVRAASEACKSQTGAIIFVMKIDHIESINLRHEYPASQRFHYAGGTCTGRLTSLVRVHTDCGRCGIGAGYTHPVLFDVIVKDQLEPLLVGADPREVEALWDVMYRVTRWYGRKGAAMTALGALDTAFWDLRAQAFDKPLWSLLGGESATCPAYASALLWKDVDALAAEAAVLVERGFRRVKMRLARSEEYDIAAVRAVRKAVGPDVDVMVDASMRYNVELARRIAVVLEEEGVFWFEEPFAPEDLDSYTALRGSIRVPLAAGENEFGAQGFRELVRTGAVDVVQPDASRAGGISEVLRVGEFARAANLRLATHSWSDAIAIIANAHAVSSLACGVTVEVDQTGNPFVDSLLETPLQIENGMLQLGDAPGLGVKLDERAIAHQRLSDPRRVPDGNYSDMLFGAKHLTREDPYKELNL